MTKTEVYLVIVVGILAMLVTMNYVGDIMHRIDINEYTDGNNNNWLAQSKINDYNNKVHSIETSILDQMDKDIKSNMKVVNQLIGIILGDGYA